MTQDNLEKRVEKIILRFLNNLYKAPDGEVLSQATKAILELIKSEQIKVLEEAKTTKGTVITFWFETSKEDLEKIVKITDSFNQRIQLKIDELRSEG